MNPSREDFESLVSLVDQACDAAVSAKVNGAYNAGDLRCVDVTWCIERDGHEFWRIYIEEAAPDAYLVHAKISEYLKDSRVKQDFEIKTEW